MSQLFYVTSRVQRRKLDEASALKNIKRKFRPARRVLIIVENLSVPFDRRVWSEATTLRDAGYEVSIICPMGQGFTAAEETIDGIHVYRHSLPLEAHGPLQYLLEYSSALFWQFVLSLKVARRHGFDVIHACNPPDLIFLIGAFYKIIAGKSFVFDHHDVCPQLYEAKFNRRDFFWQLLRVAERLTFKLADISIATNQSYQQIAIQNGGMRPEKVFVVRSGPNLDRIKSVQPDARWFNGRRFLVAYVGVISKSEGLDLLLQAIDHIVHKLHRNDIQFVVVGSGPEWQKVTRMCAKLSLGDYVAFTGRVDDPILLQVLSTADVCVNPDRVSPMTNISTMNKIMEYMAIGKPIVQFDVVEGRASAQGSSLYAKANDPIDFADKILQLIEDPKTRTQMGKFGRRRVNEELAWSHERPKLLTAYDALFALRDQRQSWFSRLTLPSLRDVSSKKLK
jgi:glycosyltransferase involved in cell wall biosynthesis